jgi:hypothetical protein
LSTADLTLAWMSAPNSLIVLGNLIVLGKLSKAELSQREFRGTQQLPKINNEMLAIVDQSNFYAKGGSDWPTQWASAALTPEGTLDILCCKS